jgi:hypothetical protein
MSSGGEMKKFYTAVLTFSVLLLLCVNVNAQYQFIGGGYFYDDDGAMGATNGALLDFTFPGGGARAAGMGGAFIGFAEGEMAFSWNPATMIYTDKTKFGIQFLSQSDKNTNVSVSSLYEIYPEAFVRDHDLKRENTRLNYGGFVAPFSLGDRDWAVGGGYRGVIDLKSESIFPGFITEQNRFDQNKAVDAISLGAAGKLTEQVGLGFTLNSYVRGTESKLYLADFLAAENVQTGDTLYVGLGYEDKATFSGFNADIGLSGDFGMFKAGVVVHTPISLKFKNTYTEMYYVPPVPVGNIFRQTITYNIPFSYSAGLAVTPIENFTFAFDFDQKPMSKLDIDVDWEIAPEGDTVFGNITDRTIEPEWNDLNQFRVGMEYMIDAGFADIPLRAGYRNQPSILNELTKMSDVTGYDYGDQITTPIMTFGSGVYHEKIWFDLAYQFGSSSYDRVVEFDGAENTYEIKTDYSKIFFSVGMYF